MALYPHFNRQYNVESLYDSPLIWILMRQGQILVKSLGERGEIRLLTHDDHVGECTSGRAPMFLGELDGVHYVTLEIATDVAIPEDWTSVGLRSLYGVISDGEWAIAGYAAHLLHWERTSRFCPSCGSSCTPMGHEWVRACTSCGQERYPSISPAVLALVHDGGDRVLLAHKPGWGEMHSIIAGFVLPGESLEECVHREVAEEIGVMVTDLKYQGSQPWPFPQQLMIGFTAQWQSGAIVIDREELDGAKWFDVRSLPPLPQPLSLSRRIIDSWRADRLDATY